MGEEKVVVPKDIVENIKRLAEKTNVNLDTLKQRFKEIYLTNETVKALDNPEAKARVAWAILASQFVTRGRLKKYNLYVISKSSPRKVVAKGEPTLVQDLYCLVKSVEDEQAEIEYGVVTLWRDAVNKAKDIEVGKVYQGEFIENKNKWGVSLMTSETEFVEVEDSFPSIEEFYKQNIEPLNIKITLAEADLNKSEFSTDIREIEATVIHSDIGTSTDGREFGVYSIIDDTYFDMVEGGKIRGFTVWCNPDQVKWDVGSVLKFIGTIDVDDEGNPRMFCHFIIPTKLAIKKEIVKKPSSSQPSQEEIDVSKIPPDAKEIEKKIEEKMEDEIIF